MTLEAPACLKSLAAASHVAPVVITSSTNPTVAPAKSKPGVKRKASRTLRNLSRGSKLLCGSVFRLRRRALDNTGAPEKRLIGRPRRRGCSSCGAGVASRTWGSVRSYSVGGMQTGFPSFCGRWIPSRWIDARWPRASSAKRRLAACPGIFRAGQRRRTRNRPHDTMGSHSVGMNRWEPPLRIAGSLRPGRN